MTDPQILLTAKQNVERHRSEPAPAFAYALVFGLGAAMLTQIIARGTPDVFLGIVVAVALGYWHGSNKSASHKLAIEAEVRRLSQDK